MSNKDLFKNPEMQDGSLEEARRVVRIIAKRGISCPCCDRLVKVYRRKIHAEMVIWLIGLYTLSKKADKFYTTLDILQTNRHLRAGGTNGTLLIHWGLIEKLAKENRAGAPAGSYKITSKGEKFVNGKINVWQWVELLNGELYEVSTESTNVRQALGTEFNYNELMRGL